ncbi:GNAT family N-acetyltransferase [Methanosarcina horonobensis]|nr:N-acetyltransferase [Methanosarcina horonobensis]
MKVRELAHYLISKKEKLDFVKPEHEIESKMRTMNLKSCAWARSKYCLHIKKGIGSLLMNCSIEKARQLGYKAIFLFGNPEYYKRFGFRNTREYNIQTPSGENFDAFMALELYNGSLKQVSGKFFASSSFEVTEEELKNFEKEFPHKTKHVTDTQLFH